MSAFHLVIHANQSTNRISPNIYGQFAEHLGRGINGGIWVGEESTIPNTRGIRNDVVAALRKLKVPVLRWPGGCFADEYHWRDGIGPPAQRPVRVNARWGWVLETNRFGTHEFFDLCEQLGCQPYICANLGSGSVQELMEWIEYITSDSDSDLARLRRKNGREKPWKLPFLGLGNESWGCGGSMTPQQYVELFRRYNTFVRDFPGNQIYRVASGPNNDDYHWAEALARGIGEHMDGLSLHYYTLIGTTARLVSEADWPPAVAHALQLDNVLNNLAAILAREVPQKRVGLVVDEWGAWHAVEQGTRPEFLYQQNSLLDALLAATTLNILNNHASRVKMANVSEMINVLQSMILTDEQRLVLTPTYHVFELFAGHQGAKLLPSEVKGADFEAGGQKIPPLNVSASLDQSGQIHATLCNLNPRAPALLTCEVRGRTVRTISAQVLTAEAMDTCNTFDRPSLVKPMPFNSFELTSAGFTMTLPPKSILAVELQ